jgi:hypothetical protein
MNSHPFASRIGTFAGSSGEWMHYAGASWFAYETGGVPLVALYLGAAAVPSVLVKGHSRAGGLLCPAALAVLALSGPDRSAELMVAAGAVMGVGGAFVSRPPAWTSGIAGAHGWAGVVGAVAAVFVPAFSSVTNTLWAAAGLTAVSALLGEEHRGAGPSPPGLQPALAALGFLAGMRVIEPSIFGRPVSAALFAAFWAIGAAFGGRVASRTDARVVVGAPFVASASAAALGVLRGPSLAFAYAAAAAGAGVVGGAAPDGAKGPWAGRAWVLVTAVPAGALWGIFVIGREDRYFGAAAILLIAGFLSLAAARRLAAAWPPGVRPEVPVQAEAAPASPAAEVTARPRVLPPMAPPRPAPIRERPAFPDAARERPSRQPAVRPEPAPPRPAVPAAAGSEEIRQAAEELRRALAEARRIRSEALALLRRVTAEPVGRARREALAVAESLRTEVNAAGRRLAGL